MLRRSHTCQSRVAAVLPPFGFPLAAWVREPRDWPGGEIFAGAAALAKNSTLTSLDLISNMVGDDGAGNQIGMAPGARWIGCRHFTGMRRAS